MNKFERPIKFRHHRYPSLAHLPIKRTDSHAAVHRTAKEQGSIGITSLPDGVRLISYAETVFAPSAITYYFARYIGGLAQKALDTFPEISLRQPAFACRKGCSPLKK